MFRKFFDIIFNIDTLNPHGLKPYDLSRKIKGEVDGKKVMIFKARSTNSNEWYIQLMVSDKGKFEDFKYQDHTLVSGEPNLFTLLSKGNELINKWLEE